MVVQASPGASLGTERALSGATLVLADRHGCAEFKAFYIEYIVPERAASST
jgi:hypothetical protein